jgi:DNA-binding NarL/FixJ family response regulator
MSNQIARRVVQVFQIPVRSKETVELLSEREHEILTHLAEGYLYKEIAEALGISTIRPHHVRNIYEAHVHTKHRALLKRFPNCNRGPAMTSQLRSRLP